MGKIRRYGWLATALFLVALPAATLAATPTLSIEAGETELHEVGIRLRLMSRSESSVWPAPTVYTYRHNKTGDILDLYDPFELWRNDQHLRHWRDRYGNVCELAEATMTVPEGFKRRHVLEKDYKAGTKRQENAEEWDMKQLSRWVQTYARDTPVGDPKELPHSMKLQKLLEFSFNGPTLAYAFYLPASAHFKMKEKWFCLVFRLNSRVDKKQAREAVLKRCLPNIRAIVKVETKGVSSHRLQKDKFSPTGEPTEERIQSRERILGSIKGLKGWWHVETEHYIIISNIRPNERRLVRRMQSDIEYLRAAYEQFMPSVATKETVGVLRAFGSDQEYEAYVGQAMKWSAGMWSTRTRELIMRPVSGRGSSARIDTALETMYHEAFHQYVYYAFDRAHPAVWFNEGHATFFEVAEITKNRLAVEENRRYSRIVERQIQDGAADLKKVLYMTYRQFYAVGDTADQRRRNYAMAWALVYYLRKGATLDTNNPYKDVLANYCIALRQTRDANLATTKAFEGIDMKKLQADFLKFWKSGSRRGRAGRRRIFREFKGWEAK